MLSSVGRCPTLLDYGLSARFVNKAESPLSVFRISLQTNKLRSVADIAVTTKLPQLQKAI